MPNKCACLRMFAIAASAPGKPSIQWSGCSSTFPVLCSNFTSSWMTSLSTLLKTVFHIYPCLHIHRPPCFYMCVVICVSLCVCVVLCVWCTWRCQCPCVSAHVENRADYQMSFTFTLHVSGSTGYFPQCWAVDIQSYWACDVVARDSNTGPGAFRANILSHGAIFSILSFIVSHFPIAFIIMFSICLCSLFCLLFNFHSEIHKSKVFCL